MFFCFQNTKIVPHPPIIQTSRKILLKYRKVFAPTRPTLFVLTEIWKRCRKSEQKYLEQKPYKLQFPETNFYNTPFVKVESEHLNLGNRWGIEKDGVNMGGLSNLSKSTKTSYCSIGKQEFSFSALLAAALTKKFQI